jgi:acetyl-CoA carboxylase biotin carboxyl carrier protein
LVELTHKDVKNIIEIIDDASHLDEIELVFAGFRLHVRRHGHAELRSRPVPAAPPGMAQPKEAVPLPEPAPSAPKAEMAAAAGEVIVRAPMLGTFYRAPSPGAKPFVEVGQSIKADDVIGVIEVMKLFNTIHAGVDGAVVRIEAENGSLVEFDQALIVIKQA